MELKAVGSVYIWVICVCVLIIGYEQKKEKNVENYGEYDIEPEKEINRFLSIHNT